MRPATRLAVAALVLVGCGSNGGAHEPVDAAAPVRLDPRGCASAWQVVFSPEQERLPGWGENLRWHDQRLYFTQRLSRNPAITSVPAAGGEARVVSSVFSFGLWIEGDRLLYANDKGELHALPLEGGKDELVLVRRTYEVDRDWGAALALGADALFWVRDENGADGRSFTIWQAPRDGQDEAALAVLARGKIFGIVNSLFLVGDLLVAYAQPSDLWVVPRAGGALRRLSQWTDALTPHFLGIAEDGSVLWSKIEYGPDRTLATGGQALLRSHVDGSEPAPFWAGKDLKIFPLKAWGDGTRGWYLSTWETDGNNGLHTTIWWVGSDGTGATRLACDPEVSSFVDTAAVGPDGLYVVVHYNNDYWSIASIHH
jgi:hypothetical protein